MPFIPGIDESAIGISGGVVAGRLCFPKCACPGRLVDSYRRPQGGTLLHRLTIQARVRPRSARLGIVFV